MRAPRAEATRRLRASLFPLVLVVAAPKCALCLLAYAGLGTALGLAGPELCGDTAAAPGWGAPLLFLVTSVAWLRFRRSR